MVSLMFRRLLFVLALARVAASNSFLSDRVLRHGGSIGRSLLQAKKSCPVDVQSMNYTIITSQCKGPEYPPDKCCSAFVDLACPYADYLNDGSNTCASDMFSYINAKGRYPQGLFASECRGGKDGLACPPSSSPSAESADNTSSASAPNGLSGVTIAGVALSVAACLLF